MVALSVREAKAQGLLTKAKEALEKIGDRKGDLSAIEMWALADATLAVIQGEGS